MISNGSANSVKMAVAMSVDRGAGRLGGGGPIRLDDGPADEPDDRQRDDDGDRHLPVERRREVRVPGLGEHDREEDEDADRAEVDEHLRGGHDRRAEQRVHAGEGPEADHHRHGGMDDVAQRDDGESGSHDADGEQEEEDAGDDVQGRWLPSAFERG